MDRNEFKNKKKKSLGSNKSWNCIDDDDVIPYQAQGSLKIYVFLTV